MKGGIGGGCGARYGGDDGEMGGDGDIGFYFLIGIIVVESFEEKGFAVKDERFSGVMGREFRGGPKASIFERLHGECVGNMELFQVLTGDGTTGIIDGEIGAEGDV